MGWRTTAPLDMIYVGMPILPTAAPLTPTAAPLTPTTAPLSPTTAPLYVPQSDTRIIRGHRLPISRYRDKLFATYRGQIAVLKIVDFFTTPAFLSPSKSRKSQATTYTAFKTNSALNKHRISRNQWTANSLSFGAERSGNYGVYYCKIYTC